MSAISHCVILPISIARPGTPNRRQKWPFCSLITTHLGDWPQSSEVGRQDELNKTGYSG
jgi:hypothetical protein